MPRDTIEQPSAARNNVSGGGSDDMRPDQDDEQPLTDDELRLARELLEAYRGARATMRMFKLALVGLAIVAASVTAWETIAAKARTWLGN